MLLRALAFYVLTVFISYGAFCAFFYQQQRSIQYKVITYQYSPEETGLKNYEFANVKTSDGIDVQGWYVPAQPGQKTILFFHGNGQVISTSIGGVSYFLNLGYGILFAEYRGFAGHAGDVSEAGLYQDAFAFMDWLLHEKNIKEQDIIFYGESLGSSLALKLAEKYDGAGVVLVASFSSVLDLAREVYWYLPVDLLLKDKFMNADVIRNVREPILIIHGTSDDIVPFAYGKKLYEFTDGDAEFVKIDRGNHVNLYELGALKYIKDFLEKL